MDAIVDLVRGSITLHIGWGRHDVVSSVYTDAVNIEFLHCGAKRSSRIDRASIGEVVATASKSQLDALLAKDFSSDYRCNAGQANDFVSFFEVSKGFKSSPNIDSCPKDNVSGNSSKSASMFFDGLRYARHC